MPPGDPLPRQVRVRLVDARSHFHALALALERTSREEYGRALATRDAEGLATHAYPVERPFEILTNYMIELARMGLDLAGKDSTGAAPAILDRLRAERVITERRRRTLKHVHEQRNELQHEYPDARAGLVYDAAVALVSELPGFFRDYGAWMRALGFARQR